jgi:hypothetical protein
MPIISHPANTNYRDNFEATFGKKAAVDAIPRRRRLMMTQAERACLNAVSEIEKMGVHPHLTAARLLIEQAQNLVADVVDARP